MRSRFLLGARAWPTLQQLSHLHKKPLCQDQQQLSTVSIPALPTLPTLPTLPSTQTSTLVSTSSETQTVSDASTQVNQINPDTVTLPLQLPQGPSILSAPKFSLLSLKPLAESVMSSPVLAISLIVINVITILMVILLMNNQIKLSREFISVLQKVKLG